MGDWRLAVVLAVALAGCDDGGSDPVEQDAGASATLTVATYNAGLARGFVDFAEERVDPVVAALSGVDVDIICLQELWAEADRTAVEAGMAANMPHTLSLPADAGECAGGACMEQETNDLVACVQPACGEVPPAMLVGCATQNCNEEVNALSADCLTCISGLIGSPLEEIVEQCGPDAGARGCYAYEGSFGTDLVSRYPMTATDTLVLDSSLNRRGVLYAKISDTPQGEVHVFCTHLSAAFSSIPYPGEGTWADEQLRQIEAMRAWIDEKAGDGKVVLMGDFNTGPAVGGLDAEVPENFAALSAGFDGTFLDQADAGCTFCGDNPLITGVDRDHSVLIDHVLLRGFGDATTQGTVFLDQAIQLDVEGMSIEAALSDHYGLKVTVE